MQERQHHRQQGGLLAAVHRRGGCKNRRRLADQAAFQPQAAGRVEKVLQWRRHVAEAGGTAQSKADAFLQIAGFDIGCALIGDSCFRRLANGRYLRHRAQAGKHAGNLLDTPGHMTGEFAHRAVMAVIKNENFLTSLRLLHFRASSRIRLYVAPRTLPAGSPHRATLSRRAVRTDRGGSFLRHPDRVGTHDFRGVCADLAAAGRHRSRLGTGEVPPRQPPAREGRRDHRKIRRTVCFPRRTGDACSELWFWVRRP
jgi:hypothetical protein